jgi:hypothetical protein
MPKPLTFFNIFPSDLWERLVQTCEHPRVTGARLRLWAIACKQDPPGTLPADPAKLQLWSGLTDRAEWDEAASLILPGWEINGDRYHIRRLEVQVRERDGRTEHGQKGARARWDRDARAVPEQCPGYAQGYAQAMPDGMPNACPTDASSSSSPSSSSSSSPEKKKSAGAPLRSAPRAGELDEPSAHDLAWIEFKRDYPKRRWQAEDEVRRKFYRLPKRDIEAVLNGLRGWLESNQWQKDGGEYVCTPHKFLCKGIWKTPPPPANPRDSLPRSLQGFADLAEQGPSDLIQEIERI